MNKRLLILNALGLSISMLMAQHTPVQKMENILSGNPVSVSDLSGQKVTEYKANPVNKGKLVFGNIQDMIRKSNEIEFQYNSPSELKQKTQSNIETVPSALYKRPYGTYHYSLIGASTANPDDIGLSYKYQSIAGSAFSIPWKFRNRSTNATSYVWAWGNQVKYSTAQDAEFSINKLGFMTPGNYYIPVVRAVNGVDTVNYNLPYITWSDGTYKSTLASSAEKAYLGIPDFYCNASTPNANQSGIFLYTDGTSLNGTGEGYIWGTCRRASEDISGYTVNTRVKYVGTTLEKPISPMIIEDITFFGYTTATVPVPAGKSLTLAFLKLDSKGKMTTDTIASSKITSDDVIRNADGYLYLPFHFYQEDPETGREMTTSMVLNEACAVTLSGLDQDGMDFGIFSDYQNKLDNTAFFGKVNEANNFLIGNYNVSDAYAMNMYMSMHAYFDYLYPEKISRNMEVGKAGGWVSDSLGTNGSLIYSFHSDIVDSISGDPLIWMNDSTVPSWLTVAYDKSYYTQYGGLVFAFNAEALPDSVIERTADVEIQTISSSAIIHIKQSLTTGTESNTVQKNLVVKSTPETLHVEFSSGFRTLSLYTVSGQLLISKAISGKSSYDIQRADLPKGVYILKLSGAQDHTIKLIN